MSLQQPVPQSMAQPRAPLQVPAAAWWVSRLERGVNPNTPEAQVAAQSTKRQSRSEGHAAQFDLPKGDFERRQHAANDVLQQQPNNQLGSNNNNRHHHNPNITGNLVHERLTRLALTVANRAINGLVGMAPPGL